MLLIVVCVTSTLIICIVYEKVNVNVAVSDFVHMCESVCLSAYEKYFHVYLLFDICCNTRRSIVIVFNEPSALMLICL